MTDNSEPNTQEVQAQPRPEAPGGGILKVTGILFTVLGGIWFIFASLFIIDRSLRGGILTMGFITYMPILILPTFYIFTGIVGIKYCNNIEKAGWLLAVGIPHLILAFVFIIPMILIGIMPNLMNVVSLILPIAYLYGAYKNLKAWKKEKLAM